MSIMLEPGVYFREIDYSLYWAPDFACEDSNCQTCREEMLWFTCDKCNERFYKSFYQSSFWVNQYRCAECQ